MNNTIVQQGRFTSNGATKTIKLRSDIDWIEVYNLTVGAVVPTVAVGVKHKWMRGLPNKSKLTTFKSNAANALNLEQYITTNGFTLIDSSDASDGALTSTITDVSTAAIPLVTNTGVNGLAEGDIVRLHDVTGAHQLDGVDFTVGENTLSDTTFSLDNMAQLTVAGTVAKWRKINSNPAFYPAKRTICDVTTGATGMTIATTVDSGFKIGQKVRVNIPSSYGMTVKGTICTITSAAGGNIFVDIPSSTFAPFVWPTSASGPFLRAEVIPVGMDTATALSVGADMTSDATVDGGYIGIELAGGASNPGGANADVVYWTAGKSFSVTNE